ncbi:MAG TPA: cysteine--tRNA ligase [Candidatus Woesearchaeota archaeon]|nr:cysteine--tRNA ligase [Candidatus Woesearchaeota archaeon]
MEKTPIIFTISNSLSKQVEEVIPKEENTVKMYSCGPTVYDFPHIGNIRYFVFVDILRRTLETLGYKVIQAVNLTDVEDKTIKGAQKEKVSLKKFTEKYTKCFFNDLKTLNIEEAEFYPKATENIKEIIEFITKLIEKGHAYEKDGNVYYKISSFEDYGKLSGMALSSLKQNAQGRLEDEYEKDDPRDFALWKAKVPEDGDIFWDSPWSKGRPGWHIECSVMSAKYLTNAYKSGKLNTDSFETIDMHTGGVDLIFPHHTNEIAQSEGVFGKQFIKYWVHCEHLLVDGKKMSKSAGNYYTLKDLLEKGFSPRAIRYAFLSTHYKQQLNFTIKNLENAENVITKLDNFVFFLNRIIKKAESTTTPVKQKKPKEEIIKIGEDAVTEFKNLLAEDLNIPKALSAMFEFINTINKRAKEIEAEDTRRILDALQEMDKVLGLFDFEQETSDVDDKVFELIEERNKARQKEDWKKADKIRDELKEKGIELIDTKEETYWKKAKIKVKEKKA